MSCPSICLINWLPLERSIFCFHNIASENTNMVSRISLFNRKSSQPSAFRKRSLRAFLTKRGSKAEKDQDQSFPQQQALTWTFSDTSDLSNELTPINTLSQGFTFQPLPPNHSQEAIDSLRRRHQREMEGLQEEISCIQRAVKESENNEAGLLTLCDEYETITREQELEISKKELKIAYLKRLIQALESKSAVETKRRKELEEKLVTFELNGEILEIESREQKLEIFKRELEIKFQKGMNESLIVHSQEEKEKLVQKVIRQNTIIENLQDDLDTANETISEQENIIGHLNEQLLLQEASIARGRRQVRKARSDTRSNDPIQKQSIWNGLTLPNL
eukprot:scaffold576_cov106-Cylindrotheca_fusiformis.AAC.1